MKQNSSKRVRKLLFRARDAARKKGVYYVCRVGTKGVLSRLANSFWYHYYSSFKSSRTFIFQRGAYNYFYHRYNTTWKNERAVEIPIVWQLAKKYESKNVLEVGNVLSNYFSVNHDIIDKYERARGVINQDAADFHPTKRYDLIISISTLEHVGWDENPHDHRISQEPEKVLQTIENLKGLLTSKGKMIVTLPLGYNPNLDKLLKNGRIQFSNRFCLRRVSKDNRWIEVCWEDIENAKYNSPFYAANWLLIGIIEA